MSGLPCWAGWRGHWFHFDENAWLHILSFHGDFTDLVKFLIDTHSHQEKKAFNSYQDVRTSISWKESSAAALALRLQQTARIQREHGVPVVGCYASDRCERIRSVHSEGLLVQMGSNGPRVCQGLGGGAPDMLCGPGTVQQVQSAENSRGMSSRD